MRGTTERLTKELVERGKEVAALRARVAQLEEAVGWALAYEISIDDSYNDNFKDELRSRAGRE